MLVVVSTGGRPIDTLPSLPANARAAEFLPYDELLPRTSVFVTNGGYGGVQCALRYGVPIVATGGKEDKPEVGARVAWSGAGRRIRTKRPSSAALRKAVLAVLGQPRYRQASERIAAQIADASGFEGLAKVVDEISAVPRTAHRRLGTFLPKDEVHVVGEWQIVNPVIRQPLPSGLRRLPHEPPIDHGETVG